MAGSARDMEAELLRLPAETRARLAERLIASLDPGIDPDAENAWLAEAERRLDELETGSVPSVPAETVFSKVRSTLK